MSIIEYLQIIATIINRNMDKIDTYYNNCKFTVDKFGIKPLGFIVEPTTGLNIILNRSLFDSDLRTYARENFLSPFSIPLIGENYYSTDYGFTTINQEDLKKAINLANKLKPALNNIMQRITFFSGNTRIIIEFSKIDKSNINYIIEIQIESINKINILFDIRKKYFEVLEDKNCIEMERLLKSIIIPKEKLSKMIQDYISKDNYFVDEFTKEELTVHKWHNDNTSTSSSTGGEYTRNRGRY